MVFTCCEALRPSTLHCCSSIVPAFDRQHLLDDFLDAQVAFPAFEAAGAEFAAVGAADLGGDAKRVAVARLAVERRVGRDEHAFDQRMVAQPPEKLLRRVARRLVAGPIPARAASSVLQSCSRKRLGQVRHRVPTGHAMDVKPFQQLRNTVGRLAPRLNWASNSSAVWDLTSGLVTVSLPPFVR